MSEKAKKIIDIIIKVVWWVVLILLIALSVGIVSAKIKGKVPKVFGYSVVHIISQSMSDTIPVGTYILIKEVSPEEIKENDIICFYSEDSLIYGRPNTHRVVEVIENDGKYEYVTKGDSNAGQDTVTAKGDKLIGRYVKNPEGLTWLSGAVQSQGMMVVFVVMFIVSVGIVLATVVMEKKKMNDK
jgi:signal peptidase